MISYHFFRILVLCFTFPLYSVATDFTCPTSNITFGSGVFPQSSNELTYFPDNYFCNLQFQIADGYAVKFTLQANITNSTLDKMFIINTLGDRTSFYNGKDTYFAPAKNASFTIRTITNTSRFWMNYEYINMATLTPQQLPIAIPTALNLTYTNQYTFTSSSTNERLIISTGSSVYDWDPYTSKIYVYDGPDVRSPCLGTLGNYIGIRGYFRVSSGNTLTLANYYNEQTYSYALVNEYSALANVNTYDFTVFSTQNDFYNSYQYATEANHAITYFLEDSNEAFLTALELQGVSPVNGTVSISPKTPTDRKTPLLSYRMSIYENTNVNLPQLIPCNLFTVTSTVPMFLLRVSANDLARQKWGEAYPGRMGSIISPSLWNQGSSPAYNYSFIANSTLHFTFNVQSAVISSPGEQLSVSIGSTGSTSFTSNFTSSVSNSGVQMANGTYMLTTFTGKDLTSSSIVNFEIDGLYGKFTTTTLKTNSAFYSVSVGFIYGYLYVYSFCKLFL